MKKGEKERGREEREGGMEEREERKGGKKEREEEGE